MHRRLQPNKIVTPTYWDQKGSIKKELVYMVISMGTMHGGRRSSNLHGPLNSQPFVRDISPLCTKSVSDYMLIALTNKYLVLQFTEAHVYYLDRKSSCGTQLDKPQNVLDIYKRTQFKHREVASALCAT
jgi:hypothetical protein